ncbi:MAG TPA: outer membrane beta-barrel protein [Vicinamibacterales bacterium]|nr:outer membrane beta-barrel protein [Vicinamibacterales bacterium]
MAQIRNVCGFAAAIALLTVTGASAQTPSPSTSRFFASVNIGGQLASRTIDMAASQSIYDETATLNASLPIGKGVVPDFGGGYRVFGDVFVGLTVSFFSNTGTASTTASIPDPLFFNRSKTVTGTQANLEHSETAILPQLIYVRTLTDKLDVVGAIGPAIIKVSQDTVNAFTVPPGTQNVTIAPTNESATGTGVNVSLGVNYNLTERYAVGGFARFAGAKVELAASPDKLNVGGMQIGAGVRVNF